SPADEPIDPRSVPLALASGQLEGEAPAGPAVPTWASAVGDKGPDTDRSPTPADSSDVAWLTTCGTADLAAAIPDHLYACTGPSARAPSRESPRRDLCSRLPQARPPVTRSSAWPGGGPPLEAVPTARTRSRVRAESATRSAQFDPPDLTRIRVARPRQ